MQHLWVNVLSVDFSWFRISGFNFTEASGFIRLTNLINAVLIIPVSVLGALAAITNPVTFINTFIFSVILFMFGSILCCFELRFGYFENDIKKYFGFMFTYIGRTLFLTYISLFIFALINDSAFIIIVGIYTLLNALLNCFVIYRHGNLLADPTQTYTTADDIAKNYAKDNPEMAQQAFTSGMNFINSSNNTSK